MTGSVSGGCVETAVVQEGLDSLADGKARLLDYGVSDDTAWDVGLACGGKMSVFVEPLDRTAWQKVRDAVQQNRPITSITVLAGEKAGQKIVIEQDKITYSNMDDKLAALMVTDTARFRLTTRTHIHDLDVLVEVYRPAPRLITIGGAHVAIALKDLAHMMGFRVIVIDPRRAFATKERFPDVEAISHLYPDKALPDIGLNADTYIAVLTHDPKIDDPALKTALPSPVPYIGVLSSTRTHQKRVERLTAAGVDPELMKRIRTPIGLNIGAKTPEEIALCIMAEIIAVRNGVSV